MKHFKSLGSRIVSIFLGLIVLVQICVYFIIASTIQSNAVSSTAEYLDVGERIVALLQDQNSQKLQRSIRVLSNDAIFKKAIQSGDMTTAQAQINDAATRIGAAYAVFISSDHRQVVFNTPIPEDVKVGMNGLIDRKEYDFPVTLPGTNVRHAHQVVVAPVQIGLFSGWVGIDLPIDEKFVLDMRRISSLDVSIMNVDAKGRWQPDLSTLQDNDLENLSKYQMATRAKAQVTAFMVMLTHERFNARSILLGENKDYKTVAILLRSLTDAVSPYHNLQLTLLFIMGFSTILFFLVSISAVRRITLPLRMLSDNARLFGKGDYSQTIVFDRHDEIGDLARAFDIMRKDISLREEEISRLAYRDPLTDLPNRDYFRRLLQEEIERAKDGYRPVCLLMLDLDRFKHVNDILGHTFGDAILKQVSIRICAVSTPQAGRVARLGGDEFAILLTKNTLEEARRLAFLISKSFEEPLLIEDQYVDLGAGIGIAVFPAHGLDAATLLSHAELAMYAAKATGSDFIVYDASFDNGSQKNLSLLSELRQAIEKNQFRLFVQPKVKMSTGEINGCEMLIRWDHPQNGLVSPDFFIPYAEKTGFIRILTQWVLEQSVILASKMKDSPTHGRISVNLSARDLLDRTLLDRFSALLRKYDVNANAFCLEITESSIMDDPIKSLITLEALHAMGAELSIDDFGTGYSSLAYLKRLPVDELKIDQSFVKNMSWDRDDAMIVQSTIDLGHNMGLRVVAEGIETEQTLELLKLMGCDHGQGFFISKPMPIKDFFLWTESWKKTTTAIWQKPSLDIVAEDVQ